MPGRKRLAARAQAESLARVVFEEADERVSFIAKNAASTGAMVELQRLAAIGQALLLVREYSSRAGLRPNDVAGALTRIIDT